MHGSYRRAFGPESVLELQKNVIVQHEDYLKQDDSDKKADALRYMAGYVVQYLHLVPQEKKFTFKETDRVLHNSAMNIAEFDPREGSIAFHNLAKYAENLLEQPWRKDFHCIKLTSGFYVHNIAAQLQNAHEILIVMGYVNLDDTTLKLIPNQKNSNLKAVSRDCYIASQECLILSQIWQHVADQEPDYPLTIGEVFEYRKNHLGDTETICNKLLYDIRARMHAVKQQHQLKFLHQQQAALKNTQRFVPVDRLIDFDVDDGTNPDEPDTPHQNFYPEREVERTQEQFKNVNLYPYKDDEHIYDPVCGEDRPLIPSHGGVQRKLSHPVVVSQQHKLTNNIPPQYFYNNTTRKSMPAVPQYHHVQQQQQQYHHNNFNTNTNNIMYSGDRNSVSPMIPKTVTSFFSTNTLNSGSRNNVSKSNSMNSINGSRGAPSSSSSSSMSQNFGNQPLIRTKVKETDLDADLMSPRDAIPPYYNGINDNRSLRTRKSMPVAVAPPAPPPANNFTNHNNQVYPDQFYPPGIVKPVAVYGSPANALSTPQMPYYQRSRLHSDNSEDVLNEAYAYASEVGQLPKGAHQALLPRPQVSSTPGQQQQPYQHQATPIPLVHGSDSESHSESNKPRNSSVPREGAHERISNTVRSGSSTDASSSWEGSVRLRKSETPPKRPSHIELQRQQIRHADSSPESDQQQVQSKNKNGYRELSSSSSAGSPATTPSRNYPRNEDLSSLDTVYYDYLLKQGQTDEVLGSGGSSGRSNINSNDIESGKQQQQQHSKRRSGSRTQDRGSSSHYHNNYSSEPEENHLYDGRRVVPKRHNDTVPRKKQNPVESNVGKPDPNYNLLSGKPSHEKNVKKSINHVSSVTNRVPDESEDPSPPKKAVDPWDCRFCTFRNMVEERVCEVCAKSKDFFEDIEPTPVASAAGAAAVASSSQQPYNNSSHQQQQQHVVFPKMYSVPNNPVTAVATGNGRDDSEAQDEELECPQCTLLNPRRARVCDACDFRLKPVESPKSLEDLAVAMDNR